MSGPLRVQRDRPPLPLSCPGRLSQSGVGLGRRAGWGWVIREQVKFAAGLTSSAIL